jgi:error-prone DNA polymerase
MICHADTVGVFQIESRAQMSMLPRLRPRCYYDLVIEVAIVRPGPIQGDMVHPYLRRRNGEEPVSYPSPDVEKVLAKTLGVPLFQEQAMALAIVAAGFTPGEADQLRRAMAAWKRKGNQIEQFGRRLIAGMLERGYDRDFAERCFQQIKGFSEYGFPESHAASFALLVYVSSWLKKHEPAAFAAALINSQPMGFYAPAQIVRDAQQHGVEVRPVDVGHSMWDCTLEETKRQRDGETKWGQPAIRLGMRLVKGLREEHADAVAAAVRERGPFTTVEGVWRASGIPVPAMRKLAGADAFGSMGLDRQGALWQVRALRDDPLPMFDGVQSETEAPDTLPEVLPFRKVMHDYASVRLSLKAHPMSFIRDELDRRRAVPAVQLQDEGMHPNGRRVAVAGIALVRQRPSTASGIVFMTLEDETGIANLILRPKIYERFRAAARHGVTILATGQVERQGEVVHVMVSRLETLDDRFRQLKATSRDFH